MDAFSTLAAASALVLIMTHIDDSLYVNDPPPPLLLSELDSKGSDSSVPVDAEKCPVSGGYWCVIA
jgi:hypothetical protein